MCNGDWLSDGKPGVKRTDQERGVPEQTSAQWASYHGYRLTDKGRTEFVLVSRSLWPDIDDNLRPDVIAMVWAMC